MSTYRVRTPLQLAANIIGPPAAVLAAWLMTLGNNNGNGGLTPTNVALVMAVVTVLFALVDWLAGITTSVASALALNYYHTEPFHTLRVTDSRDMLSIGLLLVLGLTASGVLSGYLTHARISAEAAKFSSAWEHKHSSSRVPLLARLLQRGQPPSLQFLVPRGVPL